MSEWPAAGHKGPSAAPYPPRRASQRTPPAGIAATAAIAASIAAMEALCDWTTRVVNNAFAHMIIFTQMYVVFERTSAENKTIQHGAACAIMGSGRPAVFNDIEEVHN